MRLTVELFPTVRRHAEEGAQMITGEQVKAARKLLGWSQQVLAGHVGVSGIFICNIERGRRVASEWIFRGIRETLEAAGVEFTNGGQPGVRLAPRSESRERSGKDVI
jgi:transcriptional regulator with XRE-family HTH domain